MMGPGSEVALLQDGSSSKSLPYSLPCLALARLAGCRWPLWEMLLGAFSHPPWQSDHATQWAPSALVTATKSKNLTLNFCQLNPTNSPSYYEQALKYLDS